MIKNKHQLNINEEEIPELYRPLLLRLQSALSEPKILEAMNAEDEFLEELENMDRALMRAHLALKQERAEKEKALLEKEKLLALLQELGIKIPE